jgi:hypothetical protein
VFADGELTESDFHDALDRHVRLCDSAGKDAHDYFADDADTRPVSVNEVNTDLDQNADDMDDQEQVMNMASYVGEYIGAHGEDLFARGVEELAFRASAWATSTQMVRFSTEANEMIRDDLGDDADDLDAAPVVDVEPPTDGDLDDPQQSLDQCHDDGFAVDTGHDGHVSVSDQGWEIDSIGRVDADGETCYKQKPENGVEYVAIEGSEHLDPPRDVGQSTPTMPTTSTTLNRY